MLGLWNLASMTARDGYCVMFHMSGWEMYRKNENMLMSKLATCSLFLCSKARWERNSFLYSKRTEGLTTSSSFFTWFINKSISMLLPINKHQQTNLLATTAESTRAQEIAGVSLQIKPLNSSPCIQHGPNIYQTFIAAKLFASAQHLQSILSLERGLPTGGLSAIQRVLCVRMWSNFHEVIYLFFCIASV